MSGLCLPVKETHFTFDQNAVYMGDFSVKPSTMFEECLFLLHVCICNVFTQLHMALNVLLSCDVSAG